MELDVDLDTMIDMAVSGLPRGRRGAGRAAPSFLREIEEDDLPTILTRPAAPPSERPMARIRHHHHLAAKLLADGQKPVEVALATGFTPARINQLSHDPAFMELIAHYKVQADAKWLNVHERLASLGVSVTEELMERLEKDPDQFSNEELRRLTETTLDRGGYGPKSTRDVNVRMQSVSVNLIEQIKAENAPRGDVQHVQTLMLERGDNDDDERVPPTG